MRLSTDFSNNAVGMTMLIVTQSGCALNRYRMRALAREREKGKGRMGFVPFPVNVFMKVPDQDLMDSIHLRMPSLELASMPKYSMNFLVVVSSL